MGRRTRGPLLTYDGTTYRLANEAVGDLIARCVIVPDEENRGRLRLDLEHGVEEIEPFASPVERLTGEEAREETSVEGRRRLLAARFGHRDGQAGGR
jgi:hypothetical protein